MKLYREVKCSDRLPEKRITNDGKELIFSDTYFVITDENKMKQAAYFHFENNSGWFASNGVRVEVTFWLEPYELPTEEEIKQVILLNITHSNGLTKITEAILNLLKGEKK